MVRRLVPKRNCLRCKNVFSYQFANYCDICKEMAQDIIYKEAFEREDERNKLNERM